MNEGRVPTGVRRAGVVALGAILALWVLLAALLFSLRIGWVADDGGCVGHTPLWAVGQAALAGVGVLAGVRAGRELWTDRPAGRSGALLVLVAAVWVAAYLLAPAANRAAASVC